MPSQEDNLGFWKTEFTAPFHLIATLDEVLESFFSEFSWHAVLADNQRGDMPEMSEPWCMRAYSEEKPNIVQLEVILDIMRQTQNVDITAVDCEHQEYKNWLLDNQQQFAPLSFGNFYIHGRDSKSSDNAKSIAIIMDASMAFGTGQHATTKNCLLQLEQLKKQGFTAQNSLDMGTGSGILSFAIAKLWHDCAILAVDMDEQSIETTKQYAQYNQLETHIKTSVGQGYDAPLVKDNAPYDLIVSNIFSGPLIAMAPTLMDHLAPSGYAILSGFLTHDADAVKQAYETQKALVVTSVEDDNWVTLVIQKP